MKHLWLFLIFIVGTANAQQDVAGFFHVNIGASFARGDFASVEGSNPASGFAKNGFSINALFGHQIYKQFGGFASLNLSAHPVNNRALASAFEELIPTYGWTAKGSFWALTGYMFGPQFSQNTKRMAFDLRASAGALNYISPKLEFSGLEKNGSGTIKVVQEQHSASAFAIGLGASIKYEVKPGWVMLLNADFYEAQPEFSNVKVIYQQSGLADRTEYVSFKQEFRMIQSSIGLGYVF
ncbi:MAG: hypothetical protein LPK45_04375 [Bacteroidota bacterium]|nr:hypothetical protein [Bacteroidota bacterium]MDX5430290.1 hypothetical protein [Bacteroidota bacterium]MDX5469051.1 hypothetical protein [Bacteroidota bacterium]